MDLITRPGQAAVTAPILILALAACAMTRTGGTTMDRTAENKELVRRVVTEGVNRADLALLRETLSPDYARHSQATTATPEIRGRDQMMGFLHATFEAFPDWHESIELMLAEGDLVAYITTGTGTHTGAFGDVPATGKRVEITNYIVQRIADGQIAETWIGWDNLAFLQQIGLFPPPEGGPR
ncbi:MAG TPA: ester cyclase [Longimicrobiales bacterium]|nr:ester cyclase [Longimicrobiales bacterium]